VTSERGQPGPGKVVVRPLPRPAEKIRMIFYSMERIGATLELDLDTLLEARNGLL
jgi:hypothetical protein